MLEIVYTGLNASQKCLTRLRCSKMCGVGVLYLVIKAKEAKIVNGLMSCDVLPVAMFRASNQLLIRIIRAPPLLVVTSCFQMTF